MAFDLEHFIARCSFVKGQLATATDLNNVGEVATRNLVNQLAWQMNNARQIETPDYISGTGKGVDFLVTDLGSGQVSVNTGIGWVLDTGVASPGDAFDADRYQPVVLATTSTVTLPVPSSFPRIDAIYAKAKREFDTNDNRSVLPGPASTSVDLRSVWEAEIGVQQGTNGLALPPSPAAPADGFEVARVLWLDSSTYAVYDTRPVVEVSEAAKAPPMGVLSNSFVLQTLDKPSTELKVTQVIPAAMAVSLNAGIAVMSGRSFRVPFQTFDISDADPSDDRYDTIEIRNDTGVAYTNEGTPGAGIPAPVFADSMVIAQILVPAAATTIVGANINDTREINKYLSWGQMQSGQTITDATFQSGTIGTGNALAADIDWDLPAISQQHWHVLSAEELTALPSIAGVANLPYYNTGDGWVSGTGASGVATIYVPLGWLPHNAELASIRVLYERDTGSSGEITLKVEYSDFSTSSPGTWSLVATQTENGGGSGFALMSLGLGGAPVRGTTVSGAAARRLRCSIALNNGGSVAQNMRVYGVQVGYITASMFEALGMGGPT